MHSLVPPSHLLTASQKQTKKKPTKTERACHKDEATQVDKYPLFQSYV